MQNAASALLIGWDPIQYLRLAGTERVVADAVLRVAVEKYAEDRTNLAESIGAACANALARSFRP